jgi:5-methylcytosine-specific restriction protein B
MLLALQYKKNVVLEGPPGVGKTFIAKHLAHAFIKFEDPRKVEMIQFHQSYSYEDFIQGFRPTPKGTFELRSGVFYNFCRKAQRDPDGKYVFIIDEINRGNLSKILGEVMMLIEPDKRGEKFAIQLTYSPTPEDKFFIPPNLYIIGLMNTADRSLAMVDYALRRRFRFITLEPEFTSPKFSRFLQSKKASQTLIDKIVTRMTSLNEVIADGKHDLGQGYRIGHSYFCPQDGQPLDDNWYKAVVHTEIAPLLKEYWLDDKDEVEKQVTALLA